MSNRNSSAAEQVSTPQFLDRIYTGIPELTPRRGASQRGDNRPVRTGLCEDLRWFIECGGAALGERGTLGGIISALEHGGCGGGTPSTDLYTDLQVGWGRNVYGDVERHRWLSAAWHALTPRSKGVLMARYSPPPAEFRSDEGFGARDRFVEGSDGARGKHAGLRTGVEALLGEYACLALILCPDAGKLLVACREAVPVKTNRAGLAVVDREKQTQRGKVRREALAAAELASTEAHAEWAESKAGADPMRTRGQRVRVVGR